MYERSDIGVADARGVRLPFGWDALGRASAQARAGPISVPLGDRAELLDELVHVNAARLDRLDADALRDVACLHLAA
ncbi:MAG TPA: hypothetical protein VNT54_00345 [Solirubrobacteraceae bacterium]|nr:hypothetical protein [Solirubrobacteraceae bacterium]